MGGRAPRSTHDYSHVVLVKVKERKVEHYFYMREERLKRKGH